jgi:hypothetical protein
MDLGFATSQLQPLQLPLYTDDLLFDSASDSCSSGASHVRSRDTFVSELC